MMSNTLMRDIEWQRVRVDDIDIAYRALGEGPPLFLISGFMATMELWDQKFLSSLAAEYRVVVFDNRGMGKTTPGKGSWGIDRFAGDTAGLIEALGYDKAHVLGWSLGGDIALSLAVNYAERVDRLISYAGDCGGRHKVPPPKYRQVLREFKEVHTPAKWAYALLFPPDWMTDHPECWQSVPLLLGRMPLRSILRQNKAYEDWEGVYDALPRLDKPVLVVTGTQDSSTPPGNADILAQRIPGSRLLRFAGAGHGLMYQDPLRLAMAIKQFLRGPAWPEEPGSYVEGISVGEARNIRARRPSTEPAFET